MDASLYKLFHILGLCFLFAAMGGLVIESYLGVGQERKGKKLTGIAHGLALLLLLMSGFGMLAKLQLGFEPWVWVKLVLWLFFGAVVVLIRRQPRLASLFWFVLPILGAFAGFLAIYKPFSG